MLTETFATVSLRMAFSKTEFHGIIYNCSKKVIFWSGRFFKDVSFGMQVLPCLNLDDAHTNTMALDVC